MLLEVVVALLWWHKGDDKGGNILCKDGSCFSCRSTIVKCTICGEDGDEGGDEGGGGGGGDDGAVSGGDGDGQENNHNNQF